MGGEPIFHATSRRDPGAFGASASWLPPVWAYLVAVALFLRLTRGGCLGISSHRRARIDLIAVYVLNDASAVVPILVLVGFFTPMLFVLADLLSAAHAKPSTPVATAQSYGCRGCGFMFSAAVKDADAST